MKKIKIPGQLKSVLIRLSIYIAVVLFGMLLKFVPKTWLVIFPILTLAISVSFIFTKVKLKVIYMSLLVVFSILFSTYYLAPRNEIYRERYKKIVNDFESLPVADIEKLKIIYYKRGDTYKTYGEYKFIIK